MANNPLKLDVQRQIRLKYFQWLCSCNKQVYNDISEHACNFKRDSIKKSLEHVFIYDWVFMNMFLKSVHFHTPSPKFNVLLINSSHITKFGFP
jgi:hypothetical protein